MTHFGFSVKCTTESSIKYFTATSQNMLLWTPQTIHLDIDHKWTDIWKCMTLLSYLSVLYYSGADIFKQHTSQRWNIIPNSIAYSLKPNRNNIGDDLVRLCNYLPLTYCMFSIDMCLFSSSESKSNLTPAVPFTLNVLLFAYSNFSSRGIWSNGWDLFTKWRHDRGWWRC